MVDDADFTKVDEAFLCKYISDLGEDQAKELIEKAEVRAKAADQSGLSISHAMKMIGQIKIAMGLNARHIDKILELQREQKTLIAEQDGDGNEPTFASMAPMEYITLDPTSEQKMQVVDHR